MDGFIAILRKDLRLELRGGDTVISLIALSVLILLVLVLAFGPGGPHNAGLGAGALWVALTFSGMLGASRTLMAERDNGCMSALVMSPIAPGVLYAAKLAVDLVFIVAVEFATVVAVVLFFNLDFGARLFVLTPVLLLGALGFAAISTLLAAVAAGTRTGDLLLPLLIVPVFAPALIAGVKASAAILAGGGLADVAVWLKIMMAFDVLFVALGCLLFEFVATER